MARLIMLIGLPGSGKSTYAKQYLDDHIENTVWCSSDGIRKELYGDENIQGNPQTVFEHLHNKVGMYLHRGYNVIYDATNVTRKNRRGVINKFNNIADIEAHIVWAPFEECVARDNERVKKVGEDVIRKFLYRWQSPNYDEGFKFINIVYNCNEGWNRIHYSNCMLDNLAIPHNNPHHQLDIDQHCSTAENYIYNKYGATYGWELVYAAAYHDIGKPFTKGYKTDPQTGKIDYSIAHYYQHDNVGGYFVYGFYDSRRAEEAVKTSWLVCNHMQPYFQSKYYKGLTGEYKDLLDKLHEADVASH
jgi:predicted kinase